MEYNASLLESNVTLQQIASALNLNITNATNVSDVSEKVFDIYDDYRAKEREQLQVYRLMTYVLGPLIILSNLSVVISSGLILKKGQQPKSTYLLLGNVSLADTIIGISIILSNLNVNAADLTCIFQIGMVVCSTTVSIFSVGLIAIDRYIYILHGLYYRRWINATRVRISIVIVWFVGMIMGFMPITGWTNRLLTRENCLYPNLFPRELVIFNSILSLIPIIVVAVLYSIILQRALKNMREIEKEKNMMKPDNSSTSEKPKLRIHRGNINNNKTLNSGITTNIQDNNLKKPIKKCSSFGDLRTCHDSLKNTCLTVKSNSIGEIHLDKHSQESNNIRNKASAVESEISEWTLKMENRSNHSEASTASTAKHHRSCILSRLKYCRPNKHEPCKCRGIMVVILTTGSFLVGWVPFLIFLIKLAIICDDINISRDICISYKSDLGGPVAIVALINCILNPIIYAWWHKGFQRAVKNYVKRWCTKQHYNSMFKSKARR